MMFGDNSWYLNLTELTAFSAVHHENGSFVRYLGFSDTDKISFRYKLRRNKDVSCNPKVLYGS